MNLVKLAKQKGRIKQKDIHKLDKIMTLGMIKNIVSYHSNINPEVIYARTRKREIVQARQIAQYFIKKIFDYTLKKVGEITGGFDSSNVSHSLKTVGDLRCVNTEYREVFEAIENEIM